MRPCARLSQPLMSLILKETNPESSQGTEGTQDLGEGELSVAKVDQLSPGKGVSEDKDPRKGSPQFLGLGCPSPGFLWGSRLSLQADSPLLFPVPARAPGPGELRHPGLRLKLHSGPGAEPVSVAWSQREGGHHAVGRGWLGGTGGRGSLAGVGPKQDLASPSDTPSPFFLLRCGFSHLLSSQYVERHFSREGTRQHSTVSVFGRIGREGRRCC